MHKTLRRCLEWRHNVESASPSLDDEEAPPQRNGAQFVDLTSNRKMVGRQPLILRNRFPSSSSSFLLYTFLNLVIVIFGF